MAKKLKLTFEQRVEALKEKCGGHWGKGPERFPEEDWQTQVANRDTRLGYWEWVVDEMGSGRLVEGSED